MGKNYTAVIPAKAGIQFLLFRFQKSIKRKNWIPAFAGMTTGVPLYGFGAIYSR